MAKQQTIKYAPQCNKMTMDNVTFQTNNVVGNFNYPRNIPAYKPIMKFLLNCPLRKAFTNCPLVVYQNFLREFWSTAVAYDTFPSTNETKQCPLREFLIKFLVLNWQRPLTLDFNTFCSSTGLDYNNGKYVAHHTPEAAKKELGKIAINPSYLDKTQVLKNSFLVAWRILFTFVIQVLGGNYSSTEQVNSIQQLLAYSLITGTEVDIGEIIYSDLVTKLLNKSRLQYVSYLRFISCALQVLLVSPLPLVAKPKKGKSKTVTPTLPKSQGLEVPGSLSKKSKRPNPKSHPLDITSMTSDESTTKTTPHPEGLLGDKDSGGNIPPADMEPIHLTVSDLSRTVLRELDTQPVVLSTYANVRAFLLSNNESKEDILGADKPQSSHAPSTEASDTDSSSDNILKKYDNTLPLTERQLVKYLRKVSNVLFTRITEDNWEKHEEVTVNYADLRASVDDYYDENIAHRDQTDKLVEASMSSLDKSSNTISDLYKDLNIITELLKEIKNAVKDDFAHALKQDEELVAWSKSSTNMAWNLGFRLSGLERAQNHIQSIMSSLKEDTHYIKNMMTEMYEVFKGQSSSSVTLTLALTHISTNVKGKNATNTTTKEPPSHTEGETGEPKRAIPISTIQPTEVLPTQAQPITTIITHPEISQAAPRFDKGVNINNV
ncbi:hypothetical protein Tco_0745300 [Tanacetum coccineum]